MNNISQKEDKERGAAPDPAEKDNDAGRPQTNGKKPEPKEGDFRDAETEKATEDESPKPSKA